MPPATANRIKDLTLHDGGHAFDARTGRSYQLNPTAVILLQLMQDGHPRQHIIATLAQRAGQHEAVVAAGVATFEDQLERHLS